MRRQNTQPLPRAAELLKRLSEAQEVQLSASDPSRQMGQQGGRFPPRTPCTGTPAAPVSQQTHLLFRIVILAGNTNDLGNQAPRQPSLFTLRFPLFSLTSTIFRGTQMKPGTIHLLLGDMHPQQPRSQVFSPCTWNSEPHFKEMLSTFLADRGRHRGSA